MIGFALVLLTCVAYSFSEGALARVNIEETLDANGNVARQWADLTNVRPWPARVWLSAVIADGSVWQ